MESFQTICKNSGQSAKLPDNLESVQIIWKVSRQPGKFPYDIECFQMTWKVYKVSGKSHMSQKGFTSFLYNPRDYIGEEKIGSKVFWLTHLLSFASLYL